MSGRIVYEDAFGATIDRPDADYLEIRWYDATAAMSGDDFEAWLSRFADEVAAARRSGILVDSLAFRMDMALMDGAWRDEHIIPRYNQAGVRRFAFLMPAGMPAIGNPPANEGPAAFPTGYFGSRADALAWLSASG